MSSCCSHGTLLHFSLQSSHLTASGADPGGSSKYWFATTTKICTRGRFAQTHAKSCIATPTPSYLRPQSVLSSWEGHGAQGCKANKHESTMFRAIMDPQTKRIRARESRGRLPQMKVLSQNRLIISIHKPARNWKGNFGPPLSVFQNICLSFYPYRYGTPRPGRQSPLRRRPRSPHSCQS